MLRYLSLPPCADPAASVLRRIPHLYGPSSPAPDTDAGTAAGPQQTTAGSPEEGRLKEIGRNHFNRTTISMG